VALASVASVALASVASVASVGIPHHAIEPLYIFFLAIAPDFIRQAMVFTFENGMGERNSKRSRPKS
jgi:hypothetical protein